MIRRASQEIPYLFVFNGYLSKLYLTVVVIVVLFITGRYFEAHDYLFHSREVELAIMTFNLIIATTCKLNFRDDKSYIRQKDSASEDV